MTGPSDEAKFVDRTQDDSSRVCYDERLAPGAPVKNGSAGRHLNKGGVHGDRIARFRIRFGENPHP